jgi:hypothetical protein
MFIKLFYPCLAAAVGFLGCLRPILSRLSEFSNEVCHFARPSSIQQVALEGVEHIIVSVASKVDEVNMMLTLVVDDMKSQFVRAAQQEETMRNVDPSLPEVPSNPRIYVERELEGAKEELRSSVLQLEQDASFDVAPWIPKHLTSSKAHRNREARSFLVVCLVLHGLGAYATLYLLDEYLSLEEASSAGAIELLAPLTSKLSVCVSCWILAFGVEAHLLSTILIGTVYFIKTSPSATVVTIQQLRRLMARETTQLLRQYGILFLCRDILEFRMERVQHKLLALIRLQYKLEMIWTILEYENNTAASVLSPPLSKLSSSPSSSAESPLSASPDHRWSPKVLFGAWRSGNGDDAAVADG